MEEEEEEVPVVVVVAAAATGAACCLPLVIARLSSAARLDKFVKSDARPAVEAVVGKEGALVEVEAGFTPSAECAAADAATSVLSLAAPLL